MFSGWGWYVDARLSIVALLWGRGCRCQGGVAALMLRCCYVLADNQDCQQSSEHCRCTEKHVPKESCNLALQIAMKQRSCRGCRGWTDEKMASTASQAACPYIYICIYIYIYICIYIYTRTCIWAISNKSQVWWWTTSSTGSLGSLSASSPLATVRCGEVWRHWIRIAMVLGSSRTFQTSMWLWSVRQHDKESLRLLGAYPTCCSLFLGSSTTSPSIHGCKIWTIASSARSPPACRT